MKIIVYLSETGELTVMPFMINDFREMIPDLAQVYGDFTLVWQGKSIKFTNKNGIGYLTADFSKHPHASFLNADIERWNRKFE